MEGKAFKDINKKLAQYKIKVKRIFKDISKN